MIIERPSSFVRFQIGKALPISEARARVDPQEVHPTPEQRQEPLQNQRPGGLQRPLVPIPSLYITYFEREGCWKKLDDRRSLWLTRKHKFRTSLLTLTSFIHSWLAALSKPTLHTQHSTMSVVAKIWDSLRTSYTRMVVGELNNYGTSCLSLLDVGSPHFYRLVVVKSCCSLFLSLLLLRDVRARVNGLVVSAEGRPLFELNSASHPIIVLGGCQYLPSSTP